MKGWILFMKIPLIKFIVVYLLCINFFAFLLMRIDKQRAIRHKWRISEKRLFLSALLGGSLGSMLGMYFFHHKTRHWYFKYGIPLLFLLQILFFLWLNKI